MVKHQPNRGQISGRAHEDPEARERNELAKEGYAFYSEESKEFAAANLKAVSEALDEGGL